MFNSEGSNGSAYKTFSINNRRYLGNKYRLLPFIQGVVERECPDFTSFADIFSGTGAVSSAFTDRQIITNDLLYSNYISNLAWFGGQAYCPQTIIDLVVYYNSLSVQEENYMTRNFSNTFFSHDDCAKIGFVREDIESRFQAGEINERERALLITSLLWIRSPTPAGITTPIFRERYMINHWSCACLPPPYITIPATGARIWMPIGLSANWRPIWSTLILRIIHGSTAMPIIC